MDTLKRRHPIPQTPDSPPPKYSDTYEPIPLSNEYFEPTISEKDGKVYKAQVKYNKVRPKTKFNLEYRVTPFSRQYRLSFNINIQLQLLS
jgi:hypothetical protein